MILLILSTLAVTSAGAAVVGNKFLHLTHRSIPSALGGLFECLGISVLFMVLNVAVVTGIAIGVRTLTPAFLSAYSAGDIAFVAFSVCQAILFQAWRSADRRGLGVDR